MFVFLAAKIDEEPLVLSTRTEAHTPTELNKQARKARQRGQQQARGKGGTFFSFLAAAASEAAKARLMTWLSSAVRWLQRRRRPRFPQELLCRSESSGDELI